MSAHNTSCVLDQDNEAFADAPASSGLANPSTAAGGPITSWEIADELDGKVTDCHTDPTLGPQIGDEGK